MNSKNENNPTPIAVNKNNTPDTILDFIVNVATKASTANTKNIIKPTLKAISNVLAASAAVCPGGASLL